MSAEKDNGSRFSMVTSRIAVIFRCLRFELVPECTEARTPSINHVHLQKYLNREQPKSAGISTALGTDFFSP